MLYLQFLWCHCLSFFLNESEPILSSSYATLWVAWLQLLKESTTSAIYMLRLVFLAD